MVQGKLQGNLPGTQSSDPEGVLFVDKFDGEDWPGRIQGDRFPYTGTVSIVCAILLLACLAYAPVAIVFVMSRNGKSCGSGVC